MKEVVTEEFWSDHYSKCLLWIKLKEETLPEGCISHINYSEDNTQGWNIVSVTYIKNITRVDKNQGVWNVEYSDDFNTPPNIFVTRISTRTKWGLHRQIKAMGKLNFHLYTPIDYLEKVDGRYVVEMHRSI